jgi:hypothetical protein
MATPCHKLMLSSYRQTKHDCANTRREKRTFDLPIFDFIQFPISTSTDIKDESNFFDSSQIYHKFLFAMRSDFYSYVYIDFTFTFKSVQHFFIQKFSFLSH